MKSMAERFPRIKFVSVHPGLIVLIERAVDGFIFLGVVDTSFADKWKSGIENKCGLCLVRILSFCWKPFIKNPAQGMNLLFDRLFEYLRLPDEYILHLRRRHNPRRILRGQQAKEYTNSRLKRPGYHQKWALPAFYWLCSEIFTIRIKSIFNIQTWALLMNRNQVLNSFSMICRIRCAPRSRFAFSSFSRPRFAKNIQ